MVRVNDKVMIPQEEHPDINFVGLLIGPRGNTLKNLEKETGAKIIIRGKGSVKEGKIGRKDGQPLPGEDEPLHAYVTANNPEHVKEAVDRIKEIIRQGIEVPEGHNDLRKQQLRELALLNGTLRENDGLAKLKQLQQAQSIVTNTILCTVCGGTGHLAQDCKQKRPGDSFRQQQADADQSPADRAKMDSEYMSLMAELGEGPPPPVAKASPPTSTRPAFTAPPMVISLLLLTFCLCQQHTLCYAYFTQMQPPPWQQGPPGTVSRFGMPPVSMSMGGPMPPPPPMMGGPAPPWQQPTSAPGTQPTSTTQSMGKFWFGLVLWLLSDPQLYFFLFYRYAPTPKSDGSTPTPTPRGYHSALRYMASAAAAR